MVDRIIYTAGLLLISMTCWVAGALAANLLLMVLR